MQFETALLHLFFRFLGSSPQEQSFGPFDFNGILIWPHICGANRRRVRVPIVIMIPGAKKPRAVPTEVAFPNSHR